MSGAVVFVVPTLGVGGSERQIVVLARDLVGRGVEVEVVCLRDGGPLQGELEAAGVSVLVLGLGGRVPWRAIPRLARRWLRRRPWLVYAWLSGFDLLATLPARLARVEAVVGSRRELTGWMAPRHRLVQALGTALCDRVICVSEAVRKEAVMAEPGAPILYDVARNGVDVGRFRAGPEQRRAARAALALAEDEVAVVTVANFAPEKDHEGLLDAVAEVERRGAACRFLWAGDGPLRGELERRVRARGLERSVRFLGQVEDVPGLLAAGDLFLLGSRAEGLPNALLEAMAAGLAVVSSAVGGVREVTADGGAAWLVRAGDPVALAEAIATLARDATRRRALGASARTLAERELGLAPALSRHVTLLLRSEGSR